jgi:hypothetical protein
MNELRHEGFGPTNLHVGEKVLVDGGSTLAISSQLEITQLVGLKLI